VINRYYSLTATGRVPDFSKPKKWTPDDDNLLIEAAENCRLKGPFVDWERMLADPRYSRLFDGVQRSR